LYKSPPSVDSEKEKKLEIKITDVLDSYVKALPNPVSDILNINVSSDRFLQTKSSLQKQQTLSLSIKLFDIFGALQLQTTSAGVNVTMNVSNLPNGIYFLHVNDGVSATPEVHKVIVHH